jgi:FkbM family methyltransferase
VRDALALAWKHTEVGRPEGDAEVRLPDGRVLTCDLADHTQRKMALGTYEREETSLCRRLLRPGDVFVDVGAHIGWFSILAGLIVGVAGRVHAIEPFPATFARLRDNVARTGLTNLVPWPVAAGDRVGSARVHLQPHGDSGSTTAVDDRGVAVPKVPVDELVDDGRPVRLLKIDVEGFEPAVLEGARRMLARTEAALVEINRPGLHALGAGPDAVREPLAAAGLTDQREIFPRYARLRSAGDVTNLLAVRP